MRRLLLLGGISCCAGPLAAQGPGFEVGHLFTNPTATSYRLGFTGGILRPLSGGLHAVVVDGRYPMGNLWGAGADLSLFRSGAAGIYLAGGVEGGAETKGSKSFWTSWSAGLGYEIFPIRGLSLAAEGRYRHVGPGDYHGVEIGLRLGLDRGSKHSSGSRGEAGTSPGQLATAAPANEVTPDAEAVRNELGRDGVPADRVTLISGVVQTALDVMGMPYRWGDEGDEGFDCSGLIRYAFGKHGITVPRRSADQAKEGTEIGRDLDALRPGDVLTFAASGRRVSHVGLYLGHSRFIHSARQGVQISVLSPEDASGRWWFRRWVGARRIIG